MKLTHSFRIPYDPVLYAALRDYQREAARVWNDTLEEAVLYFRTWKRWASKTLLQANRKQAYRLHSQTVQAIVDKYDECRKGTKEKRRKGDRRARYPWRKKHFFCLPFKQNGFVVTGEQIVLKFKNDKPLLAGLLTAKAAQKRKWLAGSGLREDVTLPIPNLSGEALSACTYAEIVWRRGHYWFHYCIDTPVAEPRHEHLPLKPAGCDLGEIHSVTLATEDKALVLSGRAVRAVKQGRAKFLAELSKKMARCKKGSRQWKKYLRAKRYLQQKSDAQIKDWLHKTTKQAVDFLLAEQVTHLVIGKVDGIEKNTRKDTTKKRKTTQRRRQQLSLWEHGRLTAYLTYKAKKAGVVVEETGEAYTSQDCPFCDGRHQTRTRHFFCPVTKTGRHRDVNGAQNIARRKYPMPVTDVSVVFKQPIWIKKYRRRNGVGGDDLARAEAW